MIKGKTTELPDAVFMLMFILINKLLRTYKNVTSGTNTTLSLRIYQKLFVIS